MVSKTPSIQAQTYTVDRIYYIRCRHTNINVVITYAADRDTM